MSLYVSRCSTGLLSGADLAICDNETCRWNIASKTASSMATHSFWHTYGLTDGCRTSNGSQGRPRAAADVPKTVRGA